MEKSPKTEKQKMLDGEMFNYFDKELINERIQIKDACHVYNSLRGEENEKLKETLLKKLFKKVGEEPWIEPKFWCDYGYNITIGDYFYANHNLTILDGAEVIIGDNVLIAPDVVIDTSIEPEDGPSKVKNKKIIIGNNVWIGAKVVITGGVTIGDGTTIGAGAIVKSDIPSMVVAVGNPCKVLNQIKKDN